ncbi:glycoside hydrolase family 16 protein [Dongshaea marina]|uniref:glycoside hydrolase family 16 protein n=1 Tax=Dongshaea marina TaxID=2047966 RepID=UPI000D3EE214|nr:glycoside hydrolase family 16 protein [Dongshaea marina]
MRVHSNSIIKPLQRVKPLCFGALLFPSLLMSPVSHAGALDANSLCSHLTEGANCTQDTNLLSGISKVEDLDRFFWRADNFYHSGPGEAQIYTKGQIQFNGSDQSVSLIAEKKPSGGHNYSSGWLATQGVFDINRVGGKPGDPTIKRGAIEVTAKVAYSNGLWPAIWMMPNNDRMNDGGGHPWPGAGKDTWPAGMEIDILELMYKPYPVMSTIHYPSNPYAGDGSEAVNAAPAQGISGYHHYGMEWNLTQYGDYMTFYYDGDSYFQIELHPDSAVLRNLKTGGTKNLSPEASKTAYDSFHKGFDSGYYLIMNMAVGGAVTEPIKIDGLPQEQREMRIQAVHRYIIGNSESAQES